MNITLRVALAQLEMKGDLCGSLAIVEEGLRLAADQGAQLILTPELSLTGFHRGVPAMCGSRALTAGSARVADLCRSLQVAAVVGLPFTDSRDQVFNRVVLIDASGQAVLKQDKVGLTPSEAKLFTPGSHRSVVCLQGWRIAVAMCREVLDLEVLSPLRGHIDVLLWPSYIQWGGGSDDYDDAVRQVARTLRVWIVQSNWCSAVNASGIIGLGGSIVLDPSGTLVAEAPRDTRSMQIIELKI